MAVDAAKTRPGHAGAKPCLRQYAAALGDGINARIRHGEGIRRGLKPRQRRKHALVDGEHGFDETCRAGGGLGVAEQGLDRSDPGAAQVRTFAAARHLQEAEQLLPVPDRSAGSVAFDKVQGVRAEAATLVATPHGHGLATGLGRGDAAGAVRRNAPAGDPRPRLKTQPLGFLSTHQHQHAAAFAGQEAG